MTGNGWLPIRAYWQGNEARVDWCLFGKASFTEPFFEQAVQRLLRHPFHHVFRQTTSIERLRDASMDPCPGVLPTGFIFHMSRCGSTLLSRLLAAFPDNIVLSEPPPIDFVLRAHYNKPNLARSERIDWLRGMLRAFGRKRTGDETRLFVKFDAWHIHELPLIREAFPDVPWVFLYRNPIEVLASHTKQPGAWTVPGIVHPCMLQAEASDWLPGEQDYCAKILGKLCEAALIHSREHGGILLNYNELPAALWTRLADVFQLTSDEKAISATREIIQFDAKTPSMYFHENSEEKKSSATDKMRALAARYLNPIYEQLEASRLAMPLKAMQFEL